MSHFKSNSAIYIVSCRLCLLIYQMLTIRSYTASFTRQLLHPFISVLGHATINYTGVLPALTNEGKILLASKSTISLSPDGNGGLYSALRQPLPHLKNSSILADMSSRGIHYIHAYCVDNCLVKVADPVFLGYCIQKGSECGAKVVRKVKPEEAVGVLAVKDGKYGVVEYSELSQKEAEQRTEEGELSLRAANIANHFFTLGFLEKMEEIEKEMTFHIARKKITHVNTDSDEGEIIKPTKPNGMKMELFVFDCFPFTSNLAVLEVDRAEEFSPLKNAPGTGSDDPQTSRRDILGQHRRWLIAAGTEVDEGVEVEIGAGVSYAGEGLEGLKGKKMQKNGVLGRVEDIEKLV